MSVASAPSPLVIVCDWIPPAYGAVGQYQLASARAAAAAGRQTILIGLGKANRDSEELIASVGHGADLKIVRLAARAANKSNLVQRALWAMNINLRLIDRTL